MNSATTAHSQGKVNMERKEAWARVDAALDILRVYGWTTEQRNALVNGLHRDDAVEAAERAVEQIHKSA